MVTVITPEAAAPAKPVMVVPFTTVKEPTATPPMVTAVAPDKFVPVIVNAPEFAHIVVTSIDATVGSKLENA